LEAIAASQSHIKTFRSIINDGLFPGHTLTGSCQFNFPENPAYNFALVLGGGNVIFADRVADPDLTIDIADQSMILLVEHGETIDFRHPAVSEGLSHQGRDDLYIQVMSSLQRPTRQALDLLRKVEERSRRNESLLSLTEIPRIAQLDEADLLAKIEEAVPFIVTGALNGWKFIHNSIEDFVSAHGDIKIKAATSRDSETLASFVDRAKARREASVYTLGTGLPDELVPLFPPAYFTRQQLIPPQLWMGAGRNETTPVTPLHRDLMCGFLGQVHGRKKIEFYPPHAAELLYPKSNFSSYQLCWGNPSDPDYETHPRLSEARPITAILGPGELLVQPIGWFHSVYSLDEFTMSVSYFLKN
jgi:hypothetical protein